MRSEERRRCLKVVQSKKRTDFEWKITKKTILRRPSLVYVKTKQAFT